MPTERVQITTAIEVLRTYAFTEMRGETESRKEAMGGGGADHAVELPRPAAYGQDGLGAGRRMHRGPQIGPADPVTPRSSWRRRAHMAAAALSAISGSRRLA